MLRVTVEIVPMGWSDLAENIAVLEISRANGDEDTVSRIRSRYRVDLIEPATPGHPVIKSHRTTIGYFYLHRYGWYRNRLGLAARALKMLQLRRDRGRALPHREPYGLAEALERGAALGAPEGTP